jgi:hypothetical protein
MASALALFATQAVAEAPKPPPPRPAPPARMPVQPSPWKRQNFVYRAYGRGTTAMGQPREEVRLAQIVSGSPPLAHDLKVLQTNDSASEWITFGSLIASPGNVRVGVYYDDIPIGAVDKDFAVYDLRTHLGGLAFNDESAHGWIHRSTCTSPSFEAFLKSERDSGVPDAVLNGYDFVVDNADGGTIQTIGWVDDEIVYVRWQFDVRNNSPGYYLGRDAFDLQVRVSTTPATLVSCTAPGGLGHPPGPIHVLTPGGSGPLQTMRLDGDQIMFYGAPKTPRGGVPRPAIAATANIPR